MPWDIGIYERPAVSCPDSIFISGVQSENKLYQASLTVVSDATILSPSHMYLFAGESGSLLQGFSIESGATLVVAITACQ